MSPFVLVRNMRSLGVDLKADGFPNINLPIDAGTITAEAPSTTDAQSLTDREITGNRLLARFLGARNEENLVLRVSLTDYKIQWTPNTHEGFYGDFSIRQGGEEGVREAEEIRPMREEGIKEKFERNNAGMVGVSREEVEGKGAAWRALVEGEVGVEGEREGMEVDG